MLEEVLMRNAEPFPSATCASNLVGESELCSRIHFLVHANFHVSERTVSAGGGGGGISCESDYWQRQVRRCDGYALQRQLTPTMPLSHENLTTLTRAPADQPFKQN